MKNKLLIILTALMLQSCAYLPDWLGEQEEEKLAGERVSVLPKFTPSIEPDERAKEFSIIIPAETTNNNFSGAAQPAENLAISQSPKVRDKINFAGSDDYILTSAPLIQDNFLFILDGEGKISAINFATMQKIWEAKISPKENYFLGGGLAFSAGKLYATSSTGDVISFNAETGEEIWRRKFDTSIKAAPAIKENILVIKNTNNEAYGISADDGRLLWNHSGLIEDVGIVGAAAPAIAETIAIVPFSSGEVFGLNLSDGEVLWSDSLITKGRGVASSLFISDINAAPVIRDKTVYVGSSQNILTAKDVTSGKSLWEVKISITKTPWIAGDFIYLITAQDELAAIRKADGGIKWVKQLKRFENEEKNEDKISYSAPVMAGSKIIIASSDGKLNFFSPESGDLLEKISISENVMLRPVIAQGKILTLSNDGVLTILE